MASSSPQLKTIIVETPNKAKYRFQVSEKIVQEISAAESQWALNTDVATLVNVSELSPREQNLCKI